MVAQRVPKWVTINIQLPQLSSPITGPAARGHICSSSALALLQCSFGEQSQESADIPRGGDGSLDVTGSFPPAKEHRPLWVKAPPVPLPWRALPCKDTSTAPGTVGHLQLALSLPHGEISPRRAITSCGDIGPHQAAKYLYKML